MGNSNKLQRKSYWTLDIAKFFCALLIIAAHFASERANFKGILDYAFSIYIIAVPFFLCCSGFLFFKKLKLFTTKEEKFSYFIKYEKRIFTMYGLWSAVYFLFVLYRWFHYKIISLQTVLEYVHRSLVLETYPTIWFLPALGTGIAIVYFLYTKCSKKAIAVISVLLYLVGAFGYTYYKLISPTRIGEVYYWYKEIFQTTRNGLFFAVPMIFMGTLLADKGFSHNAKRFLKYAVLTVVSLILLLAECLVLKIKFKVSLMDFAFFLLPFTYFFMSALLSIELKERAIYIWFRKLSILMFTSQRLFLTALPMVFPTIFAFIFANNFLGLFLVVILTISFSVLFIKLSEKLKFLKLMI